MAKTDVVILGGARTPMAEYVGAFKDVSALELGGHAARAALERSGVQAGWVDHVVMGNALQTSGDAIYGARHVALKAGVPIETPALTVNRLCGSGIQSIVSATQMIQLGEARVALAGGMENMTQAPHVIRGARSGLRLGQGALEDSLMVALLDTHCGLYMAQTSDNLARRHSISREEMDRYALRSQQAAKAAAERGAFRDEIVPVTVQQGRKTTAVDTDDHPRPDTTLEGLAALKPSFGKDGFVTAGNASGIVDGAAAVVVADGEEARRRGLKPLASIVSWGVAGVPPEIMGIGPVPASRKALEAAGLSLKDIDLVEVNEAFAGQYLAVEKELGLEREKTNVNGGAIALGHPLGATGTRLVLTLMLELRRRKARLGLATACIGGGQGIAIIIRNEAA
ncbi:MAG TPA: acetyl-CoA C-acyltransferase [Vicinamibacteria bacterium]|nr:acetyl-CoA C-acyltransferase [Vicinamibacteria bacterium]